MGKETQKACSYCDEGAADSELWLNLIDGDKKALEKLFTRHYDDLLQYAVRMCENRELAEDSIQELFIKIWGERSLLTPVEGVKTYLWKALRNSIISKLRKRTRRKNILRKAGSEIVPGVKLNIEDLIIEHEIDCQTRRQLKRALDSLSARQREVLYLKFYSGLNYQEIEQVMAINYQTARNYVYEGLRTLKRILT